MIKLIIELLQSDDFNIGNKTIDLAKGEHELATTWKQAKQKIKRKWQLKK